MYKSYSERLGVIREATNKKISTSITPVVKKSKKELRSNVRQRFFENVSVAGFQEFYHSPSSLIRLMWILALTVSAGSISYHTVLLIELYLNRSSTYEFRQIDKDRIPFPKVTACAPTGLNTTWTYQQISLPSKEQKLFSSFSQKEKEAFLETAASLLGNSFRYIVDRTFKSNDPHYFALNHVIDQTIRNMNGTTQGLKFGGGMPTCDDLVSNCRLDGTVFDCCKNAVRLIDDDGPCYNLQVDKMDQLWDHPRSNMTPTSFTFELKLNWNYMFDYSTINGFSVHISDPYTLFGRPIAVPSATHAMIDISQPTLRKEESECLNEMKMPDTTFGPYDANGYNCKMQRYFDEVLMRFFGCVFAYGGYAPEEACTGSQGLPLKLFLAYGNPGDDKPERLHREAMFDIVHSKTRCLPLCTAWKYTPRPSYSELMRDDYTIPIGRDNTNNVAISRVTVFIGSTFYMERTENQIKTPYNTFVQITFVFSLYLGFSVITVAEMVFYGCELCLVYKKTRGCARFVYCNLMCSIVCVR